MKNGLFHELIAPYLMTILLHTLINFNLCCIQRFKSHVHSYYRVQEIRLDKATQVHQNHKTWLTSQAYSSKSINGDVTPTCKDFQKAQKQIFNLVQSPVFDSTLRSCAMGAWISPISGSWSWSRLLQHSHIPTEAVTAVSTAVWSLDHPKYTYLEGRSWSPACLVKFSWLGNVRHLSVP